MDRFVELCLHQYHIDAEKQKLIGNCSATSIDVAAHQSYMQQMSDIMEYAKSNEDAFRLTEEFKAAIMEERLHPINSTNSMH